MWPVIFTLHATNGRVVPITSYALAVLVSVGLAAVIAPSRARRMGLPGFEGHHFLALGIAGGFLGARVLFLLLNLKHVVADPWTAIGLEGGLVWYGGVAGGALATILYARHFRIPLSVLFDFAAPIVALCHGVGRIGCFLVGCCYGAPTRLPWGVVYPPSDMFKGPTGIPLHPVQLYEAAFELALASALFAWGNRPRQGRVLAAYLAAYAPFRFLMESLFRGDDRGSIGLPIPPSAFLSLLVLGVAAGLFLKLRNESRSLTGPINPR
jgi:phosphatidylglycerol---prolipoprotein diacylglyceryl transferase